MASTVLPMMGAGLDLPCPVAIGGVCGSDYIQITNTDNRNPTFAVLKPGTYAFYISGGGYDGGSMTITLKAGSNTKTFSHGNGYYFDSATYTLAKGDTIAVTQSKDSYMGAYATMTAISLTAK